jgi:hypothetical protein
MANLIIPNFRSLINQHLWEHDRLTKKLSKAISLLQVISDKTLNHKTFEITISMHFIEIVLDYIQIAKRISDSMRSSFEHYNIIKRRAMLQAKSYSESNAKIKTAEGVTLNKCVSNAIVNREHSISRNHLIEKTTLNFNN